MDLHTEPPKLQPVLMIRNVELRRALGHVEPPRDLLAVVRRRGPPEEVTGAPRGVVLGHLLWRQTFASLRHRNFRLFFGGQLISLIEGCMGTESPI